jgi:hypothetical protein
MCEVWDFLYYVEHVLQLLTNADPPVTGRDKQWSKTQKPDSRVSSCLYAVFGRLTMVPTRETSAYVKDVSDLVMLGPPA